MDGGTAHSDPLMADWMTRAELAQVLGITVPTLRRWEAEGIGPPFTRLGRAILYRRESFREWLRSKESRPSPTPKSGDAHDR